MKPIRDYFNKLKADYDVIQYIGIAKDEPKRLNRLKNNQISLLDKYNVTESEAKEMCLQNNLLSPIYDIAPRNGCFFCPNSNLKQFVYLRKNHPSLWNELRELSVTPNLCSYIFKYDKTFQEVEKEMDALEYVQQNQLTLF